MVYFHGKTLVCSQTLEVLPRIHVALVVHFKSSWGKASW